MSLLTNEAITGYREYTKRTLAYARYKIGSTYHKVSIDSVNVTSTGIVEVNFMIEPSVNGTVTEVQLFDTSGDLWFRKAESLDVSSVAEGFFYTVQIEITEKEDNS
ncbi:MAG: hypothetical protein IJL07_08905 [Lachnospiraceae bacterium]|nr:hypothetical protein [Lachnospiraceae bacterium]